MNTFQANICLLTTTLCWAPEVIFLKRMPAGVPALAVITLSTALGTLLLLVVFVGHVRRRPSWAFLRRVALLGLLTAAANTLAVVGARQVPVATSMFLLSLYVVGVPIVLVLGRRPPPARTWLGVAVILLGMALALQLGGGTLRLLPMAVLLLSVAAMSLYLVGANDTSRTCDPAQMIVYVLGFASVFALLGWLVLDAPSVLTVDFTADFVAVLFMYTIFVIAIASAVAFFAYPHLTPTNVAAVYSLQVVFAIVLAAALPGMLVQRIQLTPSIAAGCLLMVAGVLLSEVDLWGTLTRRTAREVAR